MPEIGVHLLFTEGKCCITGRSNSRHDVYIYVC